VPTRPCPPNWRSAPAPAAPAGGTGPARGAPAGEPEPDVLPHAAGHRQTIILAAIVAVLLAAAAVAVYFAATDDQRPRGRGPAVELRELNVGFDPPGDPWSADDPMRTRLGTPVRVVYRRSDPAGYVAFAARDYETRNPRARDLDDGLTGPLNRMFENVRVESHLSGATWLGRPARAFRFRAQSREGNVAGECFAVGHEGVGYWSIGWTGENDLEALLPQFEAVREKFRLLGRRDDWREKESPTTEFRGDKADYRLIDAEGVWKRAETKAEEEDPAADLFLRAKFKRRGTDFPDEASLLVYVVEGGGGDPLQDARRYVEEKRTAEIRRANDALAPAFKELTGEPEGGANPNAGEANSPVVRLHATVPGASTQARLIVVSGARVGEKLVVVHAWCDWSQRAAFEGIFMQIAGSLGAGK